MLFSFIMVSIQMKAKIMYLSLLVILTPYIYCCLAEFFDSGDYSHNHKTDCGSENYANGHKYIKHRSARACVGNKPE